ncbi:phenylacetate--CoA ligase family protein [Pseudomonas baetica]|uniref:phenylacetate--CoA ligase family protein n=1 Tax=Pseudomonas baetica TaxID=674054 RepID=UPI001EE11CE6|nr:AMP-binding protein [Pseudomonas baetica]
MNDEIRAVADWDPLTVSEALARQLAYARSLPWFRALCPQILHVQSPQDLHRLPMQAVEDDLGGVLFCAMAQASHCAPGGGLTLTSGGSTGQRKHITHSWAFNARIVSLGARVFGTADERPAVVINCLTAGEMQGAFQYAAALVERIGARLLPAGSLMGLVRIAELIHAQTVDALICTPSFAAALFNHQDIDVEQLASLRWLYYIGEPCSKQLREQLARDWPAIKIRSLGYSSTETGPIGYQCQHLEHGFYHLHADAMLLEVVDPLTLQAVAEGEAGEFLLTPLLPDHVPLLRYRIGDRGGGSCGKGRIALVAARSPCSNWKDESRLRSSWAARSLLSGRFSAYSGKRCPICMLSICRCRLRDRLAVPACLWSSPGTSCLPAQKAPSSGNCKEISRPAHCSGCPESWVCRCSALNGMSLKQPWPARRRFFFELGAPL